MIRVNKNNKHKIKGMAGSGNEGGKIQMEVLVKGITQKLYRRGGGGQDGRQGFST